MVNQPAQHLRCLIAVMVSGVVLSGTQASGAADSAVRVLRIAPVVSFQVADAAGKQEAKGCQGKEILTAKVCPGDRIEPREVELAAIINQYRRNNGLPVIPISKSLSLVANRHVRDIADNIGDLTHDWSNCAIGSNQWECMWEAPQRLGTPYPGSAYENAYGSSDGTVSASAVVRSWQGDPDHNDLLLNKGMWRNQTWRALGIGIYKGYAVMWVGAETDPQT